MIVSLICNCLITVTHAPGWSDPVNSIQADPAKKHHGGFIKRLDTNQDGQISAAEFAAGGEKMFARLDVNADGKIAKDEVPQHRKHKQGEPAPAEQPAQ